MKTSNHLKLNNLEISIICNPIFTRIETGNPFPLTLGINNKIFEEISKSLCKNEVEKFVAQNLGGIYNSPPNNLNEIVENISNFIIDFISQFKILFSWQRDGWVISEELMERKFIDEIRTNNSKNYE